MIYKFQAKDTKPHFISANNWEEAEREFIDVHTIKNAGDTL